MKGFLRQSDYQLSNESGIWMRPLYAGIPYNDGNDIEERILSVLKRTQNLNMMSSELHEECVDWPTTYHFSRRRSNLLRPFSALLSKNVLEVGAGCGAITRYLGECGGNVLAVEGSPRRASIARERTRDLANVDIVCDRFQDFDCFQSFDVVTLIGVLEYASLFTTSDHPALEMLQRTRSFLNQDGKLILAIENQLGLKYFAGFNEDHVGVPMFGIEGRYGSGEIRTYGRITLKRLLEKAGYHNIRFFAPFPDYKLPNVVISEEAFTNENFGVSSLISQATPSDPQSPGSFHFSQESVWDVVASNAIGMDLANSFVVLADKEPTHSQIKASTRELAWYFNTDRRPEYCKSIMFTEDDHVIYTESRYLYSDKSRQLDNNLLAHNIDSSKQYSNGKSLSDHFFLCRTKTTIEEAEIISHFASYYDILKKLIDPRQSIKTWDARTVIDGIFFDCIPQNIICFEGTYEYIDHEWRAKFRLTVGYLLYRAIRIFFDRISLHVGSILLQDADHSRRSLLIKIFKHVLGSHLQLEDISEFSKLEASVQSSILDRRYSTKQLENYLTHDMRKARIYTSEALTKAKAEAEQARAEADQAKAASQEVLAMLGEMQSSLSWKLVKKLHKIKNALGLRK